MSSSTSHWRIGTARERITPPLGGQMAGFDARKGVSNAVHDDLHARALVFDDGETQVALVSVEVIAVSAEFSRDVRFRVQEATGIPAGHVFLSATHTHCGPVTMNHFFNQGQPLDVEYLQSLADGIVASVKSAQENKKQRVLKTGLVACDGIAMNRRTDDGLPVDPHAGVLLVEELTGEPAAVAVIYACHTTVMGPDTLSITQDFPYFTIAKLKEKLGSAVETMYFNGAEGDLSIGHKSDLSAVGIIDSFRTFETAQRLGDLLADAVLAGMDQLTAERPELSLRTLSVSLPLKSYDALPAMTAAREHALREVNIEQTGTEMLVARQRYLFARIEEYYAKLYEESTAPEPKHLDVEVSAIRLGETVLLTLPGEVFVRIALNIREASPFPNTLFLGLTNDYIGYVPDEYATASSGYEVIASRVPWEAGALVQEAAANLLEQLHVRDEVIKG
jgi:neutral ceramidase